MSGPGRAWGQNWAQTPFLSPYGNFGGGGTDVPQPWWRDQLDSRRSMYRQTPEAQYPDGYLGTIQSRREDRLLDALKDRITQRSYQRGIHLGERIDPGDYLWPKVFGPELGLEREAQGLKFAPIAGIAQRNQPQELQMLPRGSQSLVQIINPERQEQLRRFLPEWR